MKFFTVKEEGEIELIPLADLHLGSECCNLRKVHEAIKYINDTPIARAVLLGYILETAIIGSRGNPYTAESLDNEFRLAKEILMPIKDKIIGFVSGNHERRISKAVGFDISRLLAEKLGIEDRYSQGYLVLRISMSKTGWYVVLHHGYGGGRLKGGKINNLQRIGGNFSNADLVLIGHTHDFIVTADQKHILDKKHNLVSCQKTYYINVPSLSLEYGGYAEALAYPMAVSGMVKITLLDRKKKRLVIEA